jgi:hypothetical protein
MSGRLSLPPLRPVILPAIHMLVQRLPYCAPVILVQAVVAVVRFPVLAVRPICTLGYRGLRYRDWDDLVLVTSASGCG